MGKSPFDNNGNDHGNGHGKCNDHGNGHGNGNGHGHGHGGVTGRSSYCQTRVLQELASCSCWILPLLARSCKTLLLDLAKRIVLQMPASTCFLLSLTKMTCKIQLMGH